MISARALLFDLVEDAQTLADGFLCLFADRTGIDQDQIRYFHIPGGLISRFCQNGSYDLTVAKIHLTAVALYVEMLLVGSSIHLSGFLEEYFSLLAFVYLLLDARQGRIIIVHTLQF